MLKFYSVLGAIFSATMCFAQLVSFTQDGRYTLSSEGASYFANLSLDCTTKPAPHYYYNVLRQPGDTKTPTDIWPAFYGCYFRLNRGFWKTNFFRESKFSLV